MLLTEDLLSRPKLDYLLISLSTFLVGFHLRLTNISYDKRHVKSISYDMFNEPQSFLQIRWPSHHKPVTRIGRPDVHDMTPHAVSSTYMT